MKTAAITIKVLSFALMALGAHSNDAHASGVFFKNRILDAKLVCRTALNGVGRSRIAAIRQLNEIDSSATRKVVDTLSGRWNVPDYTFEQAATDFQKWVIAYKKYPLLKQEIAHAITQLKFRTEEFSSLLKKADQLKFPLVITHLPTAPSIDFGIVTVQAVNRTPKIAFRNRAEIEYALRKEKLELEEIKKLDAKEDRLQAVRYITLQNLHEALGAENSDTQDPLIREVRSLIGLDRKADFDLIPPEAVIQKIKKAIDVESSLTAQAARKTVRGLGRFFSGTNKFLGSTKTVLEKLILPQTIITLSLAVLLLAQRSADKLKDPETIRRESIHKQLTSIAINSRSTESFANYFFTLAGGTYSEEGLIIAIEFMSGQRSSLKNDGKGRYSEEKFIEAKEFYDLFDQAYNGGDGPWGMKLEAPPLAERLKLRDENDKRFEQFVKKVQSMPNGFADLFKSLQPAPEPPKTAP